jgi:hypothetical protein
MSLPMPVESLTRDKSSLSRYLKEARLLIFHEACEVFGIEQSGERKPSKPATMPTTDGLQESDVHHVESQVDVAPLNQQIVTAYLRQRGMTVLQGTDLSESPFMWRSFMEPKAMVRFMKSAPGRNAILGGTGVGKSTYLGEFLYDARTLIDYLVVPVDPFLSAYYPNLIAAARYWLNRVGLSSEAVESILVNYRNRLLVVADDVDRFQGANRTRWIHELSGATICLVAGRNVPAGLTVDFPWRLHPLAS